VTTEKPALVFVCQRLPYPPNKGERIQSFNMIRHLRKRYRVFVGTFSDERGDALARARLREMVDGLFVAPAIRPWALVRALPDWLRGEPLSFSVFRSRRLTRWLDSINATFHPVAVVAHSSNIAAYAVDGFARGGVGDPRRILHFSDVDSEKFRAYAARCRGLKRWLLDLEARRVRREEQRLVAGADAVALVSDDEADLCRSLLTTHADRIFTLPNGVDTELFDPGRYPACPFAKDGPTFVFTGAMDYPPNVEAVVWFANRVLPLIRGAMPTARFMIVGTNPSARVRKLADNPAVVVTGRVESTAAYLAHADVAVAPLFMARGIQNKVLEAMAMARAVVASKGALTGIAATAGEHLLTAESPEEWAAHCVSLVRDRERSRIMGMAARRQVQRFHSWPAQMARLDAILGDAPVNQSRPIEAVAG
jgi:sugar transferase (PEP-CTERM/EpsH1 system associated)